MIFFIIVIRLLALATVNKMLFLHDAGLIKNYGYNDPLREK
ncbi:hypothetical protein [Pedobacter sp. BS3]|nr:hypothetical protein [Pedobacter sp. BS3]